MPETIEINETNNSVRSNTSANVAFWTAIAILILLLVLSTVILSIQLYSFATIDERVLSIKSNTDARFDVFSLQYENASGEITVIGTEGEKIIAPGTDVEYAVRLRNADKVALDYEILPTAKFYSEYKIPVYVRIIGPDETYVAGDAKNWILIEDLNDIRTTTTLKKGESVEYIFQWKWPYESGDDGYDTFLGDNVYEENIGVIVSFDVYATANTTLDDNDGLFGNVYGNTSFILIFTVLLLIAIIILLIYKFIKKRNKDKGPTPVTIPAPQQEVEIEIAPAPVCEPHIEPEVKQSKKAFVGKMSFVNINTLDQYFNDGDTVSLEKLKAMGLIPANVKQMKVLARYTGEFSKVLTVETQGISAEARVAIVKAGGKVIITDGGTDTAENKGKQ